MKNLVGKVVNDEDLHHAAFNFALTWGIAKTALVISEKFFHFPLNQYNTIDHLAIGVGLGTIAYRKAGGGLKGMAAALIAGTMFNVGWEAESKGNIFSELETSIDTITDVAAVYAGSNFISPLLEKGKNYFHRKK